MVENWYRRRSEIYTPKHLLASELGLPRCCWLLAMNALSRCDPVSSFLYIEKITLIIKKQNRGTNKYDRLW